MKDEKKLDVRHEGDDYEFESGDVKSRESRMSFRREVYFKFKSVYAILIFLALIDLIILFKAR